MKKNGFLRVLSILLVFAAILVLEFRATAGIFPEAQFGSLSMFADLILAVLLVALCYYLNWGRFREVREKWRSFREKEPASRTGRIVLTFVFLLIALVLIDVGFFRLIVRADGFAGLAMLLDILLSIAAILGIIQINLDEIKAKSRFLEHLRSSDKT